MFNIIWNLFRKSLGNGLYQGFKKSPLGRFRKYYAISTYKNIFDQYKSAGFDFRDKRILEVGCGEQFYTAYDFLAAGAKFVFLVDPVFSEKSRDLQNAHYKEYLKQNLVDRIIEKVKISTYNSLKAISSEYNGKFDFICSHFALEHFRNLDDFFRNTARLLSPGGAAFNIIDLSDHSSQVFDNRKWVGRLYRKRMLNQLRYSDYMYNLMTDKRIWVNRLLVPAYKALAQKHGLKIVGVNPFGYCKARIHSDVLKRNPTTDSKELYITHFSMMITKEITAKVLCESYFKDKMQMRRKFRRLELESV
jgi:SAM-dependent methyltransferase